MSLTTFIGRRYLVARRKQAFISLITVISTLGVAVGVMALIVALGISTGFSTRIRDKIQLLNADLNILGTWNELSPEAGEEVRRVLEEEKEVAAYAPVVLGSGLVSSRGMRAALVAKVVGIDREKQRAVIDLEPFIRGGGALAITPDGGHGAIFGVDLANRLGVDVGDEVQLVAPRLTLSPFGAVPKIATLKVSGLLNTGYYLYDGEFVYVDLDFARSLFTGQEEVTAFQVRLRDRDRLAQVREGIQEDLGLGFRVVDLLGANAEFFKALKMERLLLFLAIGLIVMVASLNIICTLILLVMEKVHDIGILRSMGASRRQILLIFLFQGMVIGVIGTLLGDALGILTCRIMDTYRVIPLSLDVYPLPYVPFITSMEQVFWVSLFALIISLGATLYPAYRASILDPVEALRYA